MVAEKVFGTPTDAVKGVIAPAVRSEPLTVCWILVEVETVPFVQVADMV